MSQSQHVVVVSCLVRNAAHDVLVVRHEKRGWELPQGRVEQGEELLAALRREVFEETGVEIAVPQIAAIWSKLSEPSALILGFVASFASGVLTPSVETPEVVWLPENEILNRISHPVNRDRFMDLLTFTGSVRFLGYTTGPYQRCVPEKPQAL